MSVEWLAILLAIFGVMIAMAIGSAESEEIRMSRINAQTVKENERDLLHDKIKICAVMLLLAAVPIIVILIALHE